MDSFEILLVLGVVGFYLYDSSMLLYTNELIFIRNRRSWRTCSTRHNPLLLGKRLYIPNPLTPNVAVFRVYWSEFELRSKDIDYSLNVFLTGLMPLGYLILLLFGLMFLCLPAVLFCYGSGAQLLWLMAIVYSNIVMIFLLVFQQREIFGLSKKLCFFLLIESLACAPFALNVLRKITLHRSQFMDPIEFARKYFDDESFRTLILVIRDEIGEQLEWIDAESPRFSSLKHYSEKVKEISQ